MPETGETIYYYGPEDVRVSFGNVPIEAAAISWKVISATTPLYAYDARYALRISQGQVIVHGTILVEESVPDYIFLKCMEYHRSGIDPESWKEFKAAVRVGATSVTSNISITVSLIDPRYSEPRSTDGYTIINATFGDVSHNISYKDVSMVAYNFVAERVYPFYRESQGLGER
jgi:hypothetical protein